jgi:Mg-chelatase subunit ChlI
MRIADMPLGATEDMVTGSLSIDKVLTEGIRSLHPGLLAKAHRGILYVDEINLLQDHIVDVLLDSAASGVNIIEREGISVSHPSRFVLVGSMNPEDSIFISN